MPNSQQTARWEWKGAIPATVLTAFLQVVGGMYATYSSNKGTVEVIQKINDLSHQVELLSVAQKGYEPRFVLLETQLSSLKERLLRLETTEAVSKDAKK